MNLAEAVNLQTEARAELEALRKATKAEEDRLQTLITKAGEVLMMSASGLDLSKIEIAERIITVTDYSRGGDARASCIQDAMKQFASGAALSSCKDLWRYYFGTKAYDRWHGQREDHEYGFGPRHGSTIFSVRLTADARSKKQSDLTAEEVEAVLHYLTNIEKIQASRRAVAA